MHYVTLQYIAYTTNITLLDMIVYSGLHFITPHYVLQGYITNVQTNYSTLLHTQRHTYESTHRKNVMSPLFGY